MDLKFSLMPPLNLSKNNYHASQQNYLYAGILHYIQKLKLSYVYGICKRQKFAKVIDQPVIAIRKEIPKLMK